MLISASSWSLDAFRAVVIHRSFTNAAASLRITQPALSTRIRLLEELLGRPVFTRGRRGVTLTAVGDRLLEYIKLRDAVDGEFLSAFASDAEESVSGTIRIAGHYSIVQHGVIPALAPFLQKHPMLQVECIVREDDLVPGILARGECDFALLQAPPSLESLVVERLGNERYILVEGTRQTSRTLVYLDSDPTDSVTQSFFAIQTPKRRPKSFLRSFLHNETMIAHGVSQGMGRAVLAEIEIEGRKSIRKVLGYRPLLLPIFLAHSEYVRHSGILSKVRSLLVNSLRSRLSR